MAALVAAARSRLPEMWSAWVCVSTTCVILSPRRRANLRYSCTRSRPGSTTMARPAWPRSEEHTSELQSQSNLVCRLLLEKKKKEVGDAGLAALVLLCALAISPEQRDVC